MTQTGIDSIRSLSEKLKRLDIRACYSSDLGRARHSASIIATALGMPFAVDGRLREQNKGLFEGKTKEEILIDYSVQFAAFKQNRHDYIIPLGESRSQRAKQCVEFLVETSPRYPDSTVVVITHCGVIEGLRCELRAPEANTACAGVNRVLVTEGAIEFARFSI